MLTTRTGFAGGHLPYPTYQQVCTKTTGHAEVVEVVYDERRLSTRQLLTEFFTLHDATVDRRAGGGQYRSAVYLPADAMGAVERLGEVQALIEELRVAGFAVTTETGTVPVLYPAGNRHQQYCSARGIVPKKSDSDEIRRILTER